jgi:hypothetical protein
VDTLHSVSRLAVNGAVSGFLLFISHIVCIPVRKMSIHLRNKQKVGLAGSAACCGDDCKKD